MIARTFGAAGPVVSALGLGCGALGEARVEGGEADRLLSAAEGMGITLFDTARSYGASEDRIGRWIAAAPGRRARVVISTKGGYGVPGEADWTAACVARGIDDALARLRTDFIDVFHLHSCPREILARGEVVGALEAARAAGKIRIAAYSGENDALDWAVESGRVGGVQCSVNPFDQGSLDGAVRTAAARGMGVLAKRALGNAPWRFVERPSGHYAEVYWERMRAMRIAPLETSWSELAVRFAVFAPGVSCALIGTASAEHLAEVAAYAARGPLPHDALARLREAFARHSAGWTGQV